MKSYVSFLSILGFAAFLLSSAPAGKASCEEVRPDWIYLMNADGTYEWLWDGDPCNVHSWSESGPGYVYVGSVVIPGCGHSQQQ